MVETNILCIAVQIIKCLENELCFLDSEKSKRRTKMIPETVDPKWNETFVYASFRKGDLQKKALELRVYDYDHISSEQYTGEVGAVHGRGRGSTR